MLGESRKSLIRHSGQLFTRVKDEQSILEMFVVEGVAGSRYKCPDHACRAVLLKERKQSSMEAFPRTTPMSQCSRFKVLTCRRSGQSKGELREHRTLFSTNEECLSRVAEHTSPTIWSTMRCPTSTRYYYSIKGRFSMSKLVALASS